MWRWVRDGCDHLGGFHKLLGEFVDARVQLHAVDQAIRQGVLEAREVLGTDARKLVNHVPA